MRVTLWTLCVLIFTLSGCLSTENTAGTVATVNGRPITLRTLQAFQEADMSDTGIFEQFSLHELRTQYGKTLGSLVVYELILQDLEEKGLGIDAAQVQKYEADIRSDYPDGEFEKYFAEHALDMDAWRETLRYNLGLQVFTEQVLRKNFVPSMEDVEAYYAAHKETFTLEDTYALYTVSHTDKAKLQNIKTLDQLLERIPQLDPSELTLTKSEVPEHWQKHIYALKGTDCTSVIQEDKMYSLFCLKEFTPARPLTAGEAYVYIEEFLAEDQLSNLFEKWLEKEIIEAKIQISKHIVKDVQ